jgi:hypothetical protein
MNECGSVCFWEVPHFIRDDRRLHENVRFENHSCRFVSIETRSPPASLAATIAALPSMSLIRSLHSWLNKKPCAFSAWLISLVQHRTLAPFDGITRIRFKGSPASHRTLSHCGSPAVCFLLRIGLARAKSINQPPGVSVPKLRDELPNGPCVALPLRR